MYLKNINLKLKMFTIIFIAILIPSITISTILYKKAENTIIKQASNTVINSLNYLVDNIDYSLVAINQISSVDVNDYNLISIINKDEDITLKRYSQIRQILDNSTNRIKNAHNLTGIDSYYLYIPEEKVMINSKSTYFQNVNENEVDFFKRISVNKDSDVWFISEAFNSNINGSNSNRLPSEKLITSNKIIYDKKGRIKAAIAINVSTNFIRDKLSRIQLGGFGETIAIDNYGNLISYTDEDSVKNNLYKYKEIDKKIDSLNQNAGSFFTTQNNEKDFVIYTISKYTNWRYIQIIPASKALGQISEIYKFFIIAILITVIALIILTYKISEMFYKPIEKLVFAMQKIENRNLDVRINDKRNDEYGKLYNGFNKMVNELNYLIKDLTNEKILKKEAYIKLLQAQINPHFLYNTLDSIYSIAKIKKVEEISVMVSALSKVFRISLSGGKDIITFREALDLAINYLTIQNVRFNGKIRYNVDIPKELMECSVPKFLIQPIVENAVYHGLERKKEGGELNIFGRSLNDNLEICVHDNGIGIKKEELINIKTSIEDDNIDGSKNYALKNINWQIKLKYGYSYGIKIKSIYEVGTWVYITMPKIFE